MQPCQLDAPPNAPKLCVTTDESITRNASLPAPWPAIASAPRRSLRTRITRSEFWTCTPGSGDAHAPGGAHAPLDPHDAVVVEELQAAPAGALVAGADQAREEHGLRSAEASDDDRALDHDFVELVGDDRQILVDDREAGVLAGLEQHDVAVDRRVDRGLDVGESVETIRIDDEDATRGGQGEHRNEHETGDEGPFHRDLLL
jgi:hypothetical protein